ncbi:hypothetical protein COOONC_06413 [Cooperia oncophora]
MIHRLPEQFPFDEFDSRFNFIRCKRKKTHAETLRRLIVDNFSGYGSAKDFLPLLSRIKTYDIRASITRDILGSLLIASMLLPQGDFVSGVMNGMLSSDIPAGILSIVLPQIVYPFLGSSRHCTLGTSFLRAK